ncbi:Aldolase-type TIM barrel protein [Rutstroemia sp. NJR-2017a BBW]|nr:Aldolase-type TIM barrel protein [Rutstroemia sp. NJR-2017a BBW]
MVGNSKVRELKPGVYGPLPTFFDDKQELDLVSYKRHLLIPVCMGSLGEAVHLSPEERTTIIRFIRKTLDDEGLQATPIVAGVGGASTRETIELSRAAADAGADAGMVILPAYYAASLNADQEQVIQYYVDICEASPAFDDVVADARNQIPLLLYNFPANAAGQDMSSAVIEAVMKKAPNLCGVKLTCGGSIGKLIRLNAALNDDPTMNSSRPYPFLLLDGLIADLTPWVSSGGHGTVSGIPNFAPRATMKLWRLLSNPTPSNGDWTEAARLQAILSRADVEAVPAGIRGMKYVLNKVHGYGAAPRRPLLPLKEAEGEVFMNALKDVLELEAELARLES